MRIKKKRWKILMVSGILLLVFLVLPPPKPLFDQQYSTVVYDKEHQLIGARISGDEQWRFSPVDSIPERLSACIVQFEDKYFFQHPGINVLSLFRAVRQNIKEKEIVSGGSTITMQVARMSRGNKKRTIYQKLREMLLAVKLELRYSKSEILSLWASHAPFGGNVVGIEAASWRYYGIPIAQLSWAECAAMAVLPNSPSIIYPGKSENQFLDKRNRLLRRLFDKEIIDELTYQLSIEETLPLKPKPLPFDAMHLMDRMIQDGYGGKSIVSSINASLQRRSTQIVENKIEELKLNGIHNAAAIIVEIESGKVRSYIGNGMNSGADYNYHVDVVNSYRSTGSLLKPFLYAALLDEGMILPKTLIKDIPTQVGGYKTENYNRDYEGAVSADEALARSLNVPAVRMLQHFGQQPFYDLLKSLGLRSLQNPSTHYGLSLILGGAEASLWELGGIYSSFARTLDHYLEKESTYAKSDFRNLTYLNTDQESQSRQYEKCVFSASSIWFTYKSLLNVARPGRGMGADTYSMENDIAYKTGTSYGFKDGWAIGFNRDYLVGVWAGNADGEGRPELTGTFVAAPLMFDLFRLLNNDSYFDIPYDDLVKVPVCRMSGHKKSPYCETVDTVWIPRVGEETKVCPYHIQVFLNRNASRRVNQACSEEDVLRQNWFVLPPAIEWYYRKKHPDYKLLPPWSENCNETQAEHRDMDLIYPDKDSRIFIPKTGSMDAGKVVFEAAHNDVSISVFWYLDEEFLGKTKEFHMMECKPNPGVHRLTIVDENGHRLIREFEIMGN